MHAGKSLIGLIPLFLFLYSCSDNTEPKPVFQNLSPEAHYVGMQSCLTCHSEVHKTYQHTGMGKSFAPAHQGNSAANFNVEKAIYEPNSDFYYFPFVKDSLMYVQEFRLNDQGDTIHNRIEQISYIVGSGHHTNSHIVSFNNYLFQAPVTYYTQDGKWDMAPSFREEGNLRFGRLLDSECITCHNHFPEHATGSLNKFPQMPSGIECERCHGPGSLHVEAINKGILVNTDIETDYTIVTPSKLPRELSMDVCERCHLQGIAVLEPGKTFYDYRPGMPLNEVVNVFLPRFGNSDQFIMASQADRLQQSKCYQKTDMTCLTCHTPHESVRQLRPTDLANMCLQCHQNTNQVKCTESETKRAEANDQCHTCHMPKSGSLDIAHVSITDHKIQKFTKPQDSTSANQVFHGLEILTKDKATALDMTNGYLALYDKYATIPNLMDSIKFYLEQTTPGSPEVFNARIHYLFNKKDYKTIKDKSVKMDTSEVNDAWTAYRIAQAFYYEKDNISAIRFIEKAVRLQPLNLDFIDKEAVILMALKRNKEAREKLEFILSENPKRPETLCNRGFLHVLQGNLPMGENLYDQAIALNPDYEQALINKAAVRMVYGKNEEVLRLIQRVLKINPENLQAQQALARVRRN